MVVLFDPSLNINCLPQEVLVGWSVIKPVVCNETLGLVLVLQKVNTGVPDGSVQRFWQHLNT